MPDFLLVFNATSIFFILIVSGMMIGHFFNRFSTSFICIVVSAGVRGLVVVMVSVYPVVGDRFL